MTSQQTGGLKPTRRTLVKGAAWSVPVVAMAGGAPAFAASQDCTENGLCFGSAGVHKCCSGGPGAFYWTDVTFENTGTSDLTVSFSFTLVTSANGSVPFTGGGSVPAGQTRTFIVQSSRYENCSQGTYSAFTIYFSDDLGGTGQANVPGGSTGGGNDCPQGSNSISDQSTKTTDESASTATSARQGSAEDATVVVPDLFGKSLVEAGFLLSSAGLTMNPSAITGTVTAQSPEAGASVAPGSTVEVTVESARGADDTTSSQDAASVEAPPPAEATRGDE